jgi:hypothetical protein
MRRGGAFTTVPFVLFFLVLSPTAVHSVETAASLSLIRGTARLSTAGASSVRLVREGASVQAADLIETGGDSRLLLRFSDRSVVDLSSDTALRVGQYAFDRRSNRRSANLALKRGTARLVLRDERSSDSLFRIETPQALILVQAALADILVQASPRRTQLCVLSGSALVRNTAALVVGSSSVGENSCVAVGEKSPPTYPVPMSIPLRRKLVRDARQF